MDLESDDLQEGLIGNQEDQEQSTKIMRSWGINTDVPSRITQTGKIVGGKKPAAPTKTRSIQEQGKLERVVNRLRMSIPVLTYAKADKHIRGLLLSSLLKECLEDKTTVVIPEGLVTQKVTVPEFNKYRSILGGVTPENEAEIS